MRRGTRSQATNTGLVSLLFMLGNQIRRMDQKPPVTIALVAGRLNLVVMIGRRFKLRCVQKNHKIKSLAQHPALLSEFMHLTCHELGD